MICAILVGVAFLVGCFFGCVLEHIDNVDQMRKNEKYLR